MLDKDEILKRIELLRLAISYSRNEQKIMNVEEGILCNQEVAAWFGVMSYRTKYPRYTIPTKIESKVLEIAQIVEETNWTRPEIF